MINLKDFFYYYDHNNPNHVAAIELLGDQLPAIFKFDEADWVKLYRTPLEAPEAPKGYSIAASESIRPGFPGLVDWSNPNYKVSHYFTVREVTNNDRRRIPEPGSEIETNILLLAHELDIVRTNWGSAIGVTSWYRPPQVNAAVGGVRNSQHIHGLAADIYPMNGQALEFEQWLERTAWKDRALGLGVISGRGFTHVDLRQKRIRWRY